MSMTDSETWQTIVTVLIIFGVPLWVFRRYIAARLRGLTYFEYLVTRQAELEAEIAREAKIGSRTPLWWVCIWIGLGVGGVLWGVFQHKHWLVIAIYASLLVPAVWVLKSERAARRRAKFLLVTNRATESNVEQ